MGADEIRSKPFSLELLGSTDAALSTDHLGFRFHHKGMNILGVATIQAVTKMLQGLGDATAPVEFIDPKGNHLVLPLLRQALNDVGVLTGEILVDKKDSHRLRDAATIQPCPGTRPGATADTRPF